MKEIWSSFLKFVLTIFEISGWKIFVFSHPLHPSLSLYFFITLSPAVSLFLAPYRSLKVLLHLTNPSFLIFLHPSAHVLSPCCPFSSLFSLQAAKPRLLFSSMLVWADHRNFYGADTLSFLQLQDLIERLAGIWDWDLAMRRSVYFITTSKPELRYVFWSIHFISSASERLNSSGTS